MHVYLINHEYNKAHLKELGLNIIGASMYPYIKVHLLDRGLSYSYENIIPDGLYAMPVRLVYEIQLLPSQEAKELYLRSQGDFIK